MKRFSLYLLREILPLYFAGLIILLLLLLGGFMLELLADALSRGVPAGLLARYLLFKLPTAAVYGIPLALLFAALLGLSRLVQDSELKAARLLGLGPGSFLGPVLLLGLLISALSIMNNELLVPRAEQRALEVQKDLLLRSPEALLEEGAFFTDSLGRSIFLRRLAPGGRLEGVTVITPGGLRGPAEVLRAEGGQLDEEAGIWRLSEVSMLVYRDARLLLDFRAAEADLPMQGLSAALPEPPDLALLPARELLQRIRSAGGRSQPAELTALHRKLAEPLAAVAFAVFALAVALFSFRRETSLGIVSVMFLTFVYYATWSVFRLLGAQGAVPPWLGGWAPLLLYLGAGTVLLAWSWRR